MMTRVENRGQALAKAVLLLILALGGRALAEPVECEARVAAIQGRLEHEAHRVRVWRWAWGVGAGAATAAQLALVPVLDDRDTRIDLLVGAGATVAVLVPVIFAPDVEDRPDPQAAGCPGRLADAQRRLAAAAAAERDARSPWLHAGNVAFNVGVGALLAFGFGHWASGILNAVVGTAVGEAQILSTPHALADGRAEAPLAPAAAPLGVQLVFHF